MFKSGLRDTDKSFDAIQYNVAEIEDTDLYPQIFEDIGGLPLARGNITTQAFYGD